MSAAELSCKVESNLEIATTLATHPPRRGGPRVGHRLRGFINGRQDQGWRTRVDRHQQVHLDQFIQGAGHLFGDLFLITTFMGEISNFTGTSEADLINQIINAKASVKSDEQSRLEGRVIQAEHDAYAVSDGISPQYVYQNCGRA